MQLVTQLPRRMTEMCLSPVQINGSEVGCRNCWQCKKDRINSLVGRCIAEKMYSKSTLSVTLTYAGGDTHNSTTLVYDDVQLMLKRLRKDFDVRYIVAGEFGSKKGRAHWHCVLFFKGVKNKKAVIPDIMDKRLEWKYWQKGPKFDRKPIGFCYFQKPDWQGLAYALKYAIKDQDQRSVSSHLAMSKKPLLGFEYLRDLAQTHVDHGLPPRSYKYKFNDIKDSKNRIRSFLMTGESRNYFMSEFNERWSLKYGNEPISELNDQYLDKVTEREFSDQEIIKRINYKPVRYIQPWVDVKDDTEFMKSDWIYAEYQGIPITIWKMGEKLEIYQGDDKWRVENPDQRKVILKNAVIKRRQKYGDYLREQLQ